MLPNEPASSESVTLRIEEKCEQVKFYGTWVGNKYAYCETENVPLGTSDEELQEMADDLAIERSGVEGWFERENNSDVEEA